MKQVLNKIERIGKKGTKYKFKFTPKQLTIQTDEKWCPDHIMLVFVHGGRRYSSKVRRLESSCTIACRRLVAWPDLVAQDGVVEFETTLYKNEGLNYFDQKVWTLVLEGSMTENRNGKIKTQSRPLASTELKMNSLVEAPTGHYGSMHIKLRPLHEAVELCEMELTIQTTKCTLAAPSDCISRPETPVSITPVPIVANETMVVTNNSSSTCREEALMPIRPSRSPIVSEAIAIPVSSNSKSKIDHNEIVPGKPDVSEIVVSLRNSRNRISRQEVSITPIASNEEVVPIISSNNKRTSRPEVPMPITPLISELVVKPNNSTIEHVLPPITPSSLVASEPATCWTTPHREFSKTANASGGFGRLSTRRTNSTTNHQKPVPPSQQEVEALISRLIAQRCPDSTPTSTKGDKNNQQQDGIVAANNGLNGGAMNTAMLDAHRRKTRQIHQEFQKIAQQISEIEQQDLFVLERIPTVEKESKEEDDLIKHHHRLVFEKDQLSRRQDQLNVQLELDEVEIKIAHLRFLLATDNNQQHPQEQDADEVDGAMIKHDDKFNDQRAFRSRRDSSSLMLELRELMDSKNELTHELLKIEAAEEEGMELNRQTLERTQHQNFLRGQQEPLSASRRLMNWFSGVEHRFK